MNDDSSNSAPVSTELMTDAPHWGGLLAIWMGLVVILNAGLWMTGVPGYNLADAVEQGAATAEERNRGEESEDVVRKEIKLQRDTLKFWTVIRAIADFLVAPMALALRALTVAVIFSGLAALTGRTVRHPQMMAACVLWQGVWVLRLAVHVVLMYVFWRPSIESSVVILLPNAQFSATYWVIMRQIDCFALIGWLTMAWSGYRLRQANIVVAFVICTGLALVDAAIWATGSLILNLGMRLAIMPQ